MAIVLECHYKTCNMVIAAVPLMTSGPHLGCVYSTGRGGLAVLVCLNCRPPKRSRAGWLQRVGSADGVSCGGRSGHTTPRCAMLCIDQLWLCVDQLWLCSNPALCSACKAKPYGCLHQGVTTAMRNRAGLTTEHAAIM